MSRSSLRPALKAHQHAPAGVAAAAVAWDPTDLDVAPYIWVDASDSETITKDGSDLVSQWDDKGGGSNNLSQGTGVNQPTWESSVQNSRDAIHAISADFFSFTRSTTIRAIALVYRWDTTGASVPIIGDATTSDFHGASNPGLYFSPWGATEVTNGALRVNGSDAGSPPAGLRNTAWGIHVITTTGNTEASQLSRDRSYGRYFDGWWGELIVLNYLPSADEITKIEGFYAHRWGLTASLPGPPTGGYTTKYLSMDGVDDTASASAAWSVPSAAYSCSLWARFPLSLAGLVNSDRLITMHGNTSTWTSLRFCIEVKPNGDMLFREGNADSAAPSSAYIGWTNVIPTDGDWHHWAFTSEGVNGGDMKVYLDGSVVMSGSSGKDLSGSPYALNLYVGTPGHGGGPTPCDIDEITIWDAELTGVQVTALWNDPNGPTTPSATNLINHLRMGDGTGDAGTTITDQVGNQDLTLANGAEITAGHPYKNEAPTV